MRVRAVSMLQLARIAESGEGWREAQSLWQALGEGPGQVEAIGFQSLIGFLTKAPDALDRLRQSIALARAETRSPRAAASRLFDVGLQLKARKLLIQARETVEAVVEIEQRVGVVPEQLASALGTLGELYAAMGQPNLAREPLERALTMRLKLSPDSDQVFGNLNNLGVVAHAQRDFKAARDYLQRALAIQTAKRPGSLAEASAYQMVGTIALEQVDLAAARVAYQRAATSWSDCRPAVRTTRMSSVILDWSHGTRGSFNRPAN